MAVLLDAVRSFDNARSAAIYSVIQTSGITAVELTDSLDNSYLLRYEAIDKLVDSLVQHDVVVVDLPTPFNGAARPLVARSSLFAVVLEPNLLGTAAARSLIAELTKFGVPHSRIAVITNLRGGRQEITKSDLERALGAPVLTEIPTKGDRAYGRAFEVLAKRLLEVVPEAPLDKLRASSGMPPSGDRRGRTPSSASNPSIGASQPAHAGRTMSARDRLKVEIHEALAKKIDMVATSRAHNDQQKLAELRSQISEITAQLLFERPDIDSVEERAELRQEIIDEVLGLGPLEELMRDEAVSEIMVNGPDNIYVERNGKLTLSSKQFVDARQLRNVIERIIAPLGRRIDEASPMVDARLPDGSRVNAIIEPLALNGATLTIRRFGTKRLEMEDLVHLGALSDGCVNLLRSMIQAKLNMLVSGGTGSGKTTFLNILSGYIPNNERIITVEDAAELYLKQEHVVRLESRPSNLEGRGQITIRDLVRNSLRMRPDRIVVGECRSGEALDMLQAMNTGHDGSLTTVHANTPRDAAARLETLVMMAGFDLPVKAIREQISSAVDVIVQTARLRDGSRKIMSITEVVGMEGDVVTMQELVKFKQSGIDEHGKVLGEFQFTGVQPHCMQRFEEMGIPFDVRDLSKMPSVSALW